MCCIPHLNCGSRYNDETSCFRVVRINEQKHAFKFGDLRSKLIDHTLNTNLAYKFGNVKIISSSVNQYKCHIFQASLFIKLQLTLLNETCMILMENASLDDNVAVRLSSRDSSEGRAFL